MNTAADTRLDLSHFTGTEAYHPWSVLFRNMVLTDGTKYLAEQAGAYWLMDAIGSYLPQCVLHGFAIVQLKKQPNDIWLFTISDGNNTLLVSQIIEYSDFPLDEIKLCVAAAHDNLWVIMLTSEY